MVFGDKLFYRRCLKLISLLLIGISFVVLLSIPFASSVDDALTQTSNNRVGTPSIAESTEKLGKIFSNVFGGIIKNVFGLLSSLFDLLENNNMLFIKSLYVVLLIAIIYSVIDMVDIFPSNKQWIKLVVSIAVGGLAFIALPSGFIELLIPSYESMFSTLLSFIPFFLILFVSLKVSSLNMGRLLWVFLTIYFWLLLFSEGIPAIENEEYILGMIYVALACLGVIMAVFLRSVRSWLFRGEAEEIISEMESMADIDSTMQQVNRRHARALARVSRS